MDDLTAADLPQAGSSPAIDLQRRLSDAALRGFFTAEPTTPKARPKNYAIAGAVALLVWAVVFGVGVAFIG